MKANRPLNCPRCGRQTMPAAGLYRCDTCGGFDNRIHDRMVMPDNYSGQWPMPAIEGRATPLTRRIKDE